MIAVPANDHGAIYVLELNRPAPEGLDEKTDAAMMAILGPVLVNTDYVDVITPGMLADITLPDLIRNGYDTPVAEHDAEKLRGLMGTVVLIMSVAFGSQELTIDLPEDVRLVTVLREGTSMSAPTPLRSESATGILTPETKKPTSDAAMSGRIASIALVGMFLIVAIMIWIAG